MLTQSGVHLLFDPTTDSLYEVFCDFTSADGFVWTVVDSFNFSNKNEFADKAFYKDYPVNQGAFTWNRFRLSWSRMNAIAKHSTHVRATCNFNTDGLKYTDYLRATLGDINVMRFFGDQCKRFEYISIRGFDCNHCTAWFAQGDSWHPHVDSYYGQIRGCRLINLGAVSSPGGEDDFGLYETVNPVHRCSSSGNCTTQWWFGERYLI